MSDASLRGLWIFIIEARPDYDHPDYTVSDWKREVLAGGTRKSYAQKVTEHLMAYRPPIPEELREFAPKTTLGKSVQRAAISEFDNNEFCTVKTANGHGWFVMRHAFETLVPFIVAKAETVFYIAKSNQENRKDLRVLGAEILYDWDGAAVPRYEEM
jgi:hypothetical protein